MTTTIIYFVSAINIVLALMLVSYNWKINKNVLFLAAFLVLLALESSMVATFNFGGDRVYYTYLLIIAPLFFLKAPMLYFFVRGIVSDSFYLKKSDILHFIPFFIHLLANMPFLLMSFDEQYQIGSNIIQNYDYFRQLRFSLYPLTWNNTGRAVQLFAYIIVCLILMRQVRFKFHRLKGQIKYQYRYTIQRIMVILFFILLIASISVILNYMFTIGLDSTRFVDSMYVLLYLMMYVYFFIPVFVILSPKLLYGLPHLETGHISATQFEEQVTESTGEQAIVKTERIQHSVEYYNDLATKILDFVESEKPYLNPDFHVKDICIHFVIPQHHVHYCLNEILHTDFNELKIEKRVTYAKAIMKNTKNPVKPEDAGYASGFSSNTSFNIAFKKYTGMTPEQWLNQDIDNDNDDDITD